MRSCAPTTILLLFLGSSALSEPSSYDNSANRGCPQTADFTAYWGNYRSNALAGFRARSPKSLVGGLAWSDLNGNIFRDLTATKAEGAESDSLRVSWRKHDGRWFGIQEIRDSAKSTNLGIELLFLKDLRALSATSASRHSIVHGLHQSFNLSTRPGAEHAPPRFVTFLPYFGMEDDSQNASVGAISEMFSEGDNSGSYGDRLSGEQDHHLTEAVPFSLDFDPDGVWFILRSVSSENWQADSLIAIRFNKGAADELFARRGVGERSARRFAVASHVEEGPGQNLAKARYVSFAIPSDRSDVIWKLPEILLSSRSRPVKPLCVKFAAKGILRSATKAEREEHYQYTHHRSQYRDYAEPLPTAQPCPIASATYLSAIQRALDGKHPKKSDDQKSSLETKEGSRSHIKWTPSHYAALQFVLRMGGKDAVNRTLDIHVFSKAILPSAQASDVSKLIATENDALQWPFSERDGCGGRDACQRRLNSFLEAYFRKDTPATWMSKQRRLKEDEFDRRFDEVFSSDSNSLPGDGTHDRPILSTAMSHHLLSNLLGGAIYVHGTLSLKISSPPAPVSVTRKKEDKKELPAKASAVVTSSPLEAFSFTPSRLTFPRPFLWDEGFHLLIIRRWDVCLFWDSFKSWMALQFNSKSNNYIKDALNDNNLKDSLPYWNGWIPREPALGLEAKKGIPEGFTVQDVQVANPPALMLPLLEVAERVAGDALAYFENFISAFLDIEVVASQLPTPSRSLLQLLKQIFSRNPPQLTQQSECINVSSATLQCDQRCLRKSTYLTQVPSSRNLLSAKGETCLMITPNSLAAFRAKFDKSLAALPEGVMQNFEALLEALRLHHRAVESILPNIKLWLSYFLRTQKSSKLVFASKEAFPQTSHSQRTPLPLYRWAGQTSMRAFASGFDDIARGLLVHEDAANVDLQAWVTKFIGQIERLCSLQDRTAMVLGAHLSSPSICSTGDLLNQHLISLFLPVIPGEPNSTVTEHISTPSSTSSQSTPHNTTSLTEVFFDQTTQLLTDNIGLQFTSPATGDILVTPPWRSDGRCGRAFPSPFDKTRPGSCNPYGEASCCSPEGWCGSRPEYCNCQGGCYRTPSLMHRSYWGSGILGPTVANAKLTDLSYIQLVPLMLGLYPLPFTATCLEQLQASNGFTDLFEFELSKVGMSLVEQNSSTLQLLQQLTQRYLLNETELLGHCGIRSLSQQSPLYHTELNYWRGYVWVHVNFLLLKALKNTYIPSVERLVKVCDCDGYHGENLLDDLKRLYTIVRERLLLTVHLAYEREETIFEHYADDEIGAGRGGRGFTGWSAAALLVDRELF